MAKNLDALLKDVKNFETDAAAGIDELLKDRAAVQDKCDEAKAELQAKADQRLVLFDEQIDKLNELYKAASGRYYIASPSSKKGKRGGGTGERRAKRSSEDLKADAEGIMAMIKAAGKDGLGGSAIKNKYPGAGQVTKFVAKHAGVTLRTEGEKRNMKYYAK